MESRKLLVRDKILKPAVMEEPLQPKAPMNMGMMISGIYALLPVENLSVLGTQLLMLSRMS
jgi:hypothetical protein